MPKELFPISIFINEVLAEKYRTSLGPGYAADHITICTESIYITVMIYSNYVSVGVGLKFDFPMCAFSGELENPDFDPSKIIDYIEHAIEALLKVKDKPAGHC